VKDEATSWVQEETKVWVAGGRVAAGRSVGHGVCEWRSRLPLLRERKGWPFRASAPCSRLSVYINSNSHELSSPVSVVFALIGNDALAGV
jgi:hypothetical protein